MNADLSSFKGIAGILSSNAHFDGTLGQIAIVGKTDTPDFRLDVSEHPVALHTDFVAVVDGTHSSIAYAFTHDSSTSTDGYIKTIFRHDQRCPVGKIVASVLRLHCCRLR